MAPPQPVVAYPCKFVVQLIIDTLSETIGFDTNMISSRIIIDTRENYCALYCGLPLQQTLYINTYFQVCMGKPSIHKLFYMHNNIYLNPQK